MPTIREWTDITEIEAIEVDIYWQAYHEIGSHPSKWDPQTRESADHSLPYLLAIALVDGTITLDSFLPERISDPSLRPLMARITVNENPEYTAQFRPPGAGIAGEPRAGIVVRKTSGEEFSEIVTYAKGHTRNPMTRKDVDAKLEMAAGDILSPDQIAAIRAQWWNIAGVDDISTPIESMVGFG